MLILLRWDTCNFAFFAGKCSSEGQDIDNYCLKIVQGSSDRSWEEASSICKDNWKLAPSNLISDENWRKFAKETCTQNQFVWLDDKVLCKQALQYNIIVNNSFVKKFSSVGKTN